MNSEIKGLSDTEVKESRRKHGYNLLSFKRQYGAVVAVVSVFKEPMVLLLILASVIYFISGKWHDGYFLLGAILFVAAISLYQSAKSYHALNKLKDLSEPLCIVIRNGKQIEIKSEDIVVEDYVVAKEGSLISADGKIVQSSDFSVNESVLTGESLPIYKDEHSTDNLVFSGTSVASGMAIFIVSEVGNTTKIGKIGKSLEAIKTTKTPLEIKINKFVTKMAFVGFVVFLIVWGINLYHSKEIIDSLLKALTLAMSVLPEEIPLAFAVFMAIGAWRLLKLGIVVKQIKTVETLGSASVICLDKTGTITENKMSLVKCYLFNQPGILDYSSNGNEAQFKLIEAAMWASEVSPMDPMERALHLAYQDTTKSDLRKQFSMKKGYPLDGIPPMMTHVFENKSGDRIVAAKGAPEAIIELCGLNATEKMKIEEAVKSMSAEGYRLLAVATSNFSGMELPSDQQEFPFLFSGIVAFSDPPKKHIEKVIDKFYKAGIKVKILTGDSISTTKAIAEKINFKSVEKVISGEEIMDLTTKKLQQAVEKYEVFYRMFPEAKLRVIKALKSNKEIVAMTGDGVNDAPALKAAHIGIAMGAKGMETAKQAASLILMDDKLEGMVVAISFGRKIYANLKKSIQYIISIHIPIIITVLIPLALGWRFPNIFYPIHVIFLELIMGPTCSIVFENEPMEPNAMSQRPRPFSNTFFNWKELRISLLQGVVISLGSLFIYLVSLDLYNDEKITRTLIFVFLILANIFISFSNRSFYFTVFTTIKFKNNLIWYISIFVLALTGAMIYWPLIANFFMFTPLSLLQVAVVLLIAAITVFWIEPAKWKKWKWLAQN